MIEVRAPGNTLQTDVAIIGGGLSGLACALALRDSGLEIALFEAGDMLGGRARSWADPATGDVVDVGPHIFLTEYRNMLALLEMLGTRDRIVWQRDRLIRLREGARATDMRLHRLPPPLHLAPSFAAVRSLGLRDKLSGWRPMWLGMRIDEQKVLELDTISAAELLRRHGVTDRLTRWFWASACMAVMNVPLERCSAGALMRVFAQIIGRASYRIGFADCPLAELYVPGAQRAIRDLGGHIHLRCAARRLVPAGDRVACIELQDGTRVQARYYVSAVPPTELAALLPAEWRAREPFVELATFEPSPYISVYLWFDRKLSGEAFWSRVYDARDLNSDFYDLANIRSGWTGRPSVTASNIIYSHRAHAMSDEEIVARTLNEIREAFPWAAAARVTASAVHRIPMAIPCPLPGSERCRPDAVTWVPNLLLAGDWTRTQLPASMESAVCSGWRAAEAVWRALERPRRIALPLQPTSGLARLVYTMSSPRASRRAQA